MCVCVLLQSVLSRKNKRQRKHGSTVNILKCSFLLTGNLSHDLLEKSYFEKIAVVLRQL